MPINDYNHCEYKSIWHSAVSNYFIKPESVRALTVSFNPSSRDVVAQVTLVKNGEKSPLYIIKAGKYCHMVAKDTDVETITLWSPA
jgi:hypothetical protein